MAIDRNTTSASLRLRCNYGTTNGKVVRKNKNYSNLKSTATDSAVMAVSNAIGTLIAPAIEGTYVITTDELIDMG